MKKNGILNSDISRVLSYMGHTDCIAIGDCGLPIPEEVERIDRAVNDVDIDCQIASDNVLGAKLATDDALEAIKKGKMAATIAQQPELIGKAGVENAVKLIKGEKIEKSIPVEVTLVTKDTLKKDKK